jgi:hypothetical protein
MLKNRDSDPIIFVKLLLGSLIKRPILGVITTESPPYMALKDFFVPQTAYMANPFYENFSEESGQPDFRIPESESQERNY